MPEITSILCPVDFSEISATAYEYARSLAYHYKAELLLQHVLYPLGPVGYDSNLDPYEQMCEDIRAEAKEKMRWFARLNALSGVQPECIVQDGLITDLILSLAEARGVSMIVMGTHGLRGIDRLMLGSVTERVLRRAKCPVLAVRRPAHHVVISKRNPEPIRLKNIVLCTDFSDHAHRASEYAVSMAKEYDADLTLLHVVETFPSSTEIEKSTALVQEQLAETVPYEQRAVCKVRPIVRIGKPYQQIIQLAIETESDLVIVGVRGRGALDTALFGSTTYRVIQLGPCPVLAVHI
jgi:nucleotide-binding universal stress UspA family protein